MKTIRIRVIGRGVSGFMVGQTTTVPAREDGRPCSVIWRDRLVPGGGCEVVKEEKAESRGRETARPRKPKSKSEAKRLEVQRRTAADRSPRS